jgi:hypothetical protein
MNQKLREEQEQEEMERNSVQLKEHVALEGITLKDLKTAVKVATLMRDREVLAFRATVREDKADKDTTIMAETKTRDQKIAQKL